MPSFSPSGHPATRARWARVLAVGWALCLGWHGSAGAVPAGVASTPARERLLIRPARQVSPEVMAAFHQTMGARVEQVFTGLGGVQVLSLPDGSGVSEAVRRYQASGLVEVAEPDYVVQATATPNDPMYVNGIQWGLDNTGQNGGVADVDIDAPEAWDLRNSAAGVVVAIVDSGLRLTHEDLAANLWTNPGEVAGNGVDDDGNGWVDDVHGINAPAASGDARDINGHGTHLAGIIGAAGNNGLGIAGVAWQVQLMSCRFLDSKGSGTTADAITCIEYARTNGARVICASWGGPDRSLLLEDAIRKAGEGGVIVVCGAGNTPTNTDLTPFYPACFDLENVVSVTALGSGGSLWDRASYGATNVDLAAPGVSVRSSYFILDNAYVDMAGTSMASAFVAGACALLAAQAPAEGPRQWLERLYAACEPRESLAGKCRTGGVLNLAQALAGTLPRLTAVGLEAGPPPHLRVEVRGVEGLAYVLESSPDLAGWAPIETNRVPAGGARAYSLPLPAGSGPGFWRAQWLR